MVIPIGNFVIFFCNKNIIDYLVNIKKGVSVDYAIIFRLPDYKLSVITSLLTRKEWSRHHIINKSTCPLERIMLNEQCKCNA